MFSKLFIIYYCQRSLAIIHHKILSVFFQTKLNHSACQTIYFYHLASIMFLDLSFSNVICRSCWNKISIISHCHIMKLLASSKFYTSNIVFSTLDLEDFDDSPKIDYGAKEPKVESHSIIFIKRFTFTNLQ